LEFFIDIKSFRSHYGPGVDSASNRNEYQEHFLGVKAAGAWGWQPYHHTVSLSRNLGTLTSWNLLGHFRPVTGLIYLYLYLYLLHHRKKFTTKTNKHKQNYVKLINYSNISNIYLSERYYGGYDAVRSFVFRDVTQCRFVASQRRFETSCRSHLSLSSSSKSAWTIWNVSPLKMGSDRFYRNVGMYQCTPCDIHEEWSSHLQRGGSLNSRSFFSI